MTKQFLFHSWVEIDEVSTRRWYATASEWGCDCGHCRNFLALAHNRKLPTWVLENLNKLGIPPEKATYVCLHYSDGDKHFYEFSYRTAGTILSKGADPATTAECCRDPYFPYAPGFPEPSFDLRFWIKLPWVLDEPVGGPIKK